MRGPKSSHYHGVRPRLKVGAYALALIMLMYFSWQLIAPGWLTYLLTVFPALIVVVTAYARLNDIDTDMASARWNVRRYGLGLTGMFALWVLARPFIGEGFPPWGMVFGVWGFALTWLTTPHQPPWGRWMRDDYSGPTQHRRKWDKA